MRKRTNTNLSTATKRLELRHLRYFLVAAEECHFSRAAAKLNVSTSAVSRQVQDLEEILNVQLFVRLPRKLHLSEHGLLLIDETRRVLEDVGRIVERFAHIGVDGISGSLKVGINDGASWGGAMPNSIRRFRMAHPNVRLELLPMSSTLALEAVASGEVDAAFAFVQTNTGRSSSLHYHDVETSRVVLAVQASHSLAGKRSIRLADLTEEPFVLQSRVPNAFYYEELLSHCAKGGLTPKVLQEVPKEASLLSLVSTGMAVGFVLAATGLWRPTDVVLREVEDLKLSARLMLVFRSRNRSSALLRFVEIVNQQSKPNRQR